MRYKENRRQETAEEVKKQQPRSLAVRQHGIEWKQCERVPSHFHKGAARHRFESGRGSTTQCRMAEPFIRNGLHYLRQVDAGECKSLARARKRACWFESNFCNKDLMRIYESTEDDF